jgi:hypothetical protein
VWEDRSAATLTATECGVTILAIIASSEEAEAFFVSQGITPPPWRTSVDSGAGQSKFGTGTSVSLSGSLQTLLSGVVHMTLTAGAPTYNLIGAVNVTDSVETGETVTVALLQGGSPVVEQTFNYEAVGGSFTLLYEATIGGGGSTTFDLQASSSSPTPATALGSLMVIATP